MWLTKLPGLVSEPERDQLQHQVQGATPARMLRECVEALAALTVDTPLVLVLEDLHWSDLSTIECLTAVAQQREPARLLVLGTYRPVETVLRAHPLRGLVQELCGRGQGVERPLDHLAAEAVTTYVTGRLGGPVAHTHEAKLSQPPQLQWLRVVVSSSPAVCVLWFVFCVLLWPPDVLQ